VIVKENRDVNKLQCEWEMEPTFRQCIQDAQYHVDFGYSGALACRRHVGAWVNWTLAPWGAKNETEVITTKTFLERCHNSESVSTEWLGRPTP
jgi:hypothetical protein